MIRFVVECHEMQYGPGIDRRDYVTVDVELPELEALLKRGGCGEGGFESWRLLGAEILPANQTAKRRPLVDVRLSARLGQPPQRRDDQHEETAPT